MSIQSEDEMADGAVELLAGDAHRASSHQGLARGWRRVVYLLLAAFFFGLGAAGAVLPGLPATPFLLLTSYFLLRTSPRLNRQLLDSRFFGPILTDWQIHGGVRTHVKIKAIVLVVLAVAVTIASARYAWVPAMVVIVLAAIGITVIIRLPSVSRCGEPGTTDNNEMPPHR